MLTRQNQKEDEGKKRCPDPRVGKRVICRSLLPAMAVLGTIQHIVCYANGVEYWNVLTDGLMVEEAPATSFILYEGPEFRVGEQVSYRLDEGGSWQATVLRPLWVFDHLRFLIRVDSDEHAAVKTERGQEFAAHPGRLARL